MRHNIRRALVPAVVSSLVATATIGTPELITSGILAVLGFVSAVVGVLVFWRIAGVAAWSPGKQRISVWLAALVTAPAGYLILLAPSIFR